MSVTFSSARSRFPTRSATSKTRPNTISSTAIRAGWRNVASITSSNRMPTIAAGMQPSTISQASRHSWPARTFASVEAA